MLRSNLILTHCSQEKTDLYEPLYRTTGHQQGAIKNLVLFYIEHSLVSLWKYNKSIFLLFLMSLVWCCVSFRFKRNDL